MGGAENMSNPYCTEFTTDCVFIVSYETQDHKLIMLNLLG